MYFAGGNHVARATLIPNQQSAFVIHGLKDPSDDPAPKLNGDRAAQTRRAWAPASQNRRQSPPLVKQRETFGKPIREVHKDVFGGPV